MNMIGVVYILFSLATFAPIVVGWGRRRQNAALYKSDRLATCCIYVGFMVPWLIGLRHFYVQADPTALDWIGCYVFVVGAVIRIVALYSLKRVYAGDVVIWNRHELVVTGIYAIVRHPLHLGMLIEVFGILLATGSIAVGVGVVLLTILVLHRNRIEDRCLVEVFGAAATRYQGNVPAMNIVHGTIVAIGLHVVGSGEDESVIPDTHE
jgi:protein-S-isoprenylcysteine O-methyltransferase Ste14